MADLKVSTVGLGCSHSVALLCEFPPPATAAPRRTQRLARRAAP